MSQDNNNGTKEQEIDQDSDTVEHNCNCFACESNQEEETPRLIEWLSGSTTLTRGDLVALYFAILLPVIFTVIMLTRRVTLSY